jgi:hypothetical protein
VTIEAACGTAKDEITGHGFGGVVQRGVFVTGAAHPFGKLEVLPLVLGHVDLAQEECL